MLQVSPFNMAPLMTALPVATPRMAPYSGGPVGSNPGLIVHDPAVNAAHGMLHPPLAPMDFQDAGTRIYKRLLKLIDTYDYPMVQFNGQRRTGPPNDWEGPVPGQGCEIFIGKIPRDLYEDELFPLLMKFGKHMSCVVATPWVVIRDLLDLYFLGVASWSAYALKRNPGLGSRFIIESISLTSRERPSDILSAVF